LATNLLCSQIVAGGNSGEIAAGKQDTTVDFRYKPGGWPGKSPDQEFLSVYLKMKFLRLARVLLIHLCAQKKVYAGGGSNSKPLKQTSKPEDAEEEQ
jgi:hypothetical protein